MFKTALVVDDSRTAQVTLGRLLKAQGLLVDMAESGSEALDYLRLNPRPVAIFLDHMMPGMDGFETLGVIKANQATAAIPVVMYTSKEDDAYFGQAHALGAAAVLQKPPQVEDVGRILAALNLTGTVTVPPTSPNVAPTPLAAHADAIPASAAPAGGGYDTSVSSPPISASAETPDAARSVAEWRAWAAPLVMLLILVSAAAAWWLFAGYQDAVSARDAALAERDRLRGDLAMAVKKLNAKPLPAPTPPVNQALLDTMAWAINQNGRYDVDEIPLDDERLELLRGLVKRLSAAGFRGTIRLDTHLGEFCLVRDDQGRYHLPPLGTPVSECEVVSYPPGEAGRLAQRKSEAFSRYIAERTESAPIDIVVVSHGAGEPLQNPHDAPNITTASQWNALARLNQRVEISILPKAPER